MGTFGEKLIIVGKLITQKLMSEKKSMSTSEQMWWLVLFETTAHIHTHKTKVLPPSSLIVC